MKKWIALFLSLLLVGSLSLTALAAEEILSLSDATGQEGDTVYLAVSLNEPVTGNTIGITYTYDSSHLRAQPDYSTWSIKGLMKDFDYNDAGVWASANTQSLSGTLCVLAFQLKAPLTDGTNVSCTVIVKNGSTLVGTYTAEATVSTSCEHQWSGWADNDAIGHKRTCNLCSAPQTQSHTWDNGVLSDNPENPYSQLRTHTCSVCSGTKTVEVFIQKEEDDPDPTLSTIPTEPKPTSPTQQQTQPTAPPYENEIPSTSTDKNTATSTKPDPTVPTATDPTKPLYRDYNESEDPTLDQQSTQQSQQNYHVHSDGSIHYGDHSEEAVSADSADHAETSATDAHDHTHETQPLISKQARNNNVILTIVVVCLMFAAGALYLKKKK